MSQEIKQCVVQFDLVSIPPRLIVQYSKNSEETQVIVNYNELSEQEKATFDAFKELSISKMV